MLLEAEGDLEIVAEAGDAESAARYVLGHKPDVLVLDLNMPGKPSLEVLPTLRESSPDTAVVVLTMQNEPAFAREPPQPPRVGMPSQQLLRDHRHGAVGEVHQLVRDAAEGGAEAIESARADDDLISIARLGHPGQCLGRGAAHQLARAASEPS